MWTNCARRQRFSRSARSGIFSAVNIGKFILHATHLDELVGLGTLTPQAARFLEPAVVAGLNVIVAGGTQAGKTTMLNCLAAATPARERMVTYQEVFELANTRE